MANGCRDVVLHQHRIQIHWLSWMILEKNKWTHLGNTMIYKKHFKTKINRQGTSKIVDARSLNVKHNYRTA